MRKGLAKRILRRILLEYGPSLGISYALLYDPGESANFVLVLKFREFMRRDYAFESKMDFATLLPPMRVDIYDTNDLPRDLLRHVFRYGELLYVGDYDEYVRDLERCLCKGVSDADESMYEIKRAELAQFR